MLQKLFNEPALYPDKKKLRPMGVVSDFVREEMPQMSPILFDEQSGRGMDAILARVQVITGKIKTLADLDTIRSLTTEDAAIFVLDIKMVHNFCTVAAVQARAFGAVDLQAAFETLRADIAAVAVLEQKKIGRAAVCHLTYEDIVLNNPASDMRVFTSGDAAQGESDFYRGHQIVEGHLQNAVDALKLVRQGRDIELNLEAALDSINALKDSMMSFRKDMKKEHFCAFKPFFSTNEYTGEKGPSGAFSAKVPHVDILLFGGNTPPEVLQYLKDNEKYFPAQDFAAARKTAAEDGSVFDVLARNGANARCRELAAEIGKTMLDFRNVHMAAARHHIGKDIQGSAEGGSAEQYLRSRIDNSAAALKKSKCPFGFGG